VDWTTSARFISLREPMKWPELPRRPPGWQSVDCISTRLYHAQNFQIGHIRSRARRLLGTYLGAGFTLPEVRRYRTHHTPNQCSFVFVTVLLRLRANGIHSPFGKRYNSASSICTPTSKANLDDSTTNERDVIRVHGPMGWCRT
jgi:hypothetical protein